MTNSTDRWLLPRRQTEYPGRDLVPEARLHGRREATFLVLAALFLVTTSALVVLGTSRTVDVSALLATLGLEVEPAIAMIVPLGVVPFALSFVASALICALFGRRRAAVLVWVGLLASLALAGVMRLADVIDGGDAFAASLAVTACYAVAHFLHLFVFDLLHRRRFVVPANVASLLAQIAGWTVFALVLHVSGGLLIEPIAAPALAALAAGAAACAFAFVLVLSIPAAIVGRALAVALRVGHDPVDEDEDLEARDHGDGPSRERFDAPVRGRFDEPARVRADDPGREPAFLPRHDASLAEGSAARRLPQAVIVDEDVPSPFTSAEMRFFTEGDAAAEGS